MTDLNMMMREQARAGLQTQLDTAVNNGDTAAATKAAEEIAKLAVQTAPKAPPYGDAEIRVFLEKAPWFGIDPKKSAKVIEFGKTMDIKKFSTAEAFATALIKAVDDEFKPVGTVTAEEPDEDETDEERETREAAEATAAEAGKKPRKTDGPGEADNNQRGTTRRASAGPWTKLSDAPSDVQKEINRTADKFVPTGATKEQRASYIKSALGVQYARHQAAKGKK